MAIIDIIKSPIAHDMTFVVNNALPSIAASYAGLASGLLYNPYNNSAFQQGDDITVLSFGFTLPLGFELHSDQGGSPQPAGEWQLREVDSGISRDLDPPFTYFIFANYEMSYNKPFDVSVSLQDFQFRLKINGLFVSMLNVPDELNGQTMYIQTFAKVSHELEMIQWG